jgi:hypothetical protein
MLLRALSQRIGRAVHDQLPHLRPAVESKITKYEVELSLDTWTVTEETVRDFILNYIGKLARRVAMQVRCEETGKRELYRSVKVVYEQFEEGMAGSCPTMDGLFASSADVEPPVWSVQKVQTLLQSYRGREVFEGTNTAATINHIVLQSMTLWQPKIQTLLDQVKTLMMAFFKKEVGCLEVYNCFQEALEHHTHCLVEQQFKRCQEVVLAILAKHGGHGHGDGQRSITMNAKELKVLQLKHLRDLSAKSQRSSLCRFCITATFAGTLTAVLGTPVASLQLLLQLLYPQLQRPRWKKTKTVIIALACFYLVDLVVQQIFKEPGRWDAMGISIGLKQSPEVETLAKAMAYCELACSDCTDDVVRSVDDLMLHFFAENLESSLRSSMQVCEKDSKDLMQIVFNEEDIQKRQNLKLQLQSAKDILKLVKQYCKQTSNFVLPNQSDANGGYNGIAYDASE